MNTGEQAVESKNGLLTTIAVGLPREDIDKDRHIEIDRDTEHEGRIIKGGTVENIMGTVESVMGTAESADNNKRSKDDSTFIDSTEATSILHGMQVEYALEGSVFVAGAAVQWLRDGLELIRHAEETESLAAEVPDSNGMYMVPAFTGLGAPYWDAYARGTIVGLTRGVTKAHFVRAVLESLAYQTYDVLKAMESDAGIELKALKVDGGASENNFILQFQSDLLNAEVKRPVVTETTALGAAYLAGLAVGYWQNRQDIIENWQVSRSFYPQAVEEEMKKYLAGWHKAVECAKGWES